jgi:hypothetical protein
MLRKNARISTVKGPLVVEITNSYEPVDLSSLNPDGRFTVTVPVLESTRVLGTALTRDEVAHHIKLYKATFHDFTIIELDI